MKHRVSEDLVGPVEVPNLGMFVCYQAATATTICNMHPIHGVCQLRISYIHNVMDHLITDVRDHN